MAESFNLNTVLKEQNSYTQRKYTAGENGKAAMAERELENAKKAIEAEKGFLGLTLQEKIKEIVRQVYTDIMIYNSAVVKFTSSPAWQAYLSSK